MKSSILSLALIVSSISVTFAQCPTTLNVSTGWENSSSSFIPDGTDDDDWTLVQTPVTANGNVGQPGTIIQKLGVYSWAGSTSKYMNYENSQFGPDNWCDTDLPFVYENPFCVCGPGEAPVNLVFSLNLHCDNWSELWLVDDQGNTLQQLITQAPYNVVSNFLNPPDNFSGTIALIPGQYSLALLQKNGGRETGVSLDGTITATEGGGLERGGDCGASTVINGNFVGSNSTGCDPNTGGEPNSCPSSLIMSTGYNNSSFSLISDNTADDDWVLTQIPNGVNLNTGGFSYVIPKHAAYDWTGSTSKYINYNNSQNGTNNWSSSQLPFIYQNGFCVCGDIGSDADVTFTLDLHCDNWAEVWLLDDSNTPIQLLVSQNYAQVVANFQNPTDHVTTTINLNAGQYSLALLQRNGGGASGVSLEAILTTSSGGGVLGNQVCKFVPELETEFYGSTVGEWEEEEHAPGNFFKRSSENGSSNVLPSYYPNPATNSIFLEGFAEEIDVVLTDLHGKLVLKQTLRSSEAIDVSSISSGVYLILATDELGNSLREKVVIE